MLFRSESEYDDDPLNRDYAAVQGIIVVFALVVVAVSVVIDFVGAFIDPRIRY